MIIKIVEKHEWYLALIKAGCPDKLLSVAFVIMDNVDGRTNSDRYGWSYLTREQIQERTGKGVSNVTAITKELAEHGWLIKQEEIRAGGRKTFYQLTYGNDFPKKVRETSQAQIAGLKRGASSASAEVPAPLGLTASSASAEVPAPLVADNKHKLETSTQTETKTSTPEDQRSAGQSPTGTILDSSEGEISPLENAKATLMRYEVSTPSSARTEVWMHEDRCKDQYCQKHACVQKRKASGQTVVGDEW